MTSPDNIFVRIQKAYAIISAVGFTKSKTVQGKNKEDHYKFIPIGQILDAVRKAQADVGITVVFGRPEYDHDNHEKRWEFKKEKINPVTGDKTVSTWYAAVGHIEVRLYGASADDCIETSVPFEAQDNSDKLTNKIITNAERNLYRTLYSIDEGSEDPEAVNIPMDNVESAEPESSIKPSNDRFFGKKDPVPAPNPKPTEVTSDRPRETMVDTIVKASGDIKLRPAVKKAIDDAGASAIDTDDWSDAQVKAIYNAVVKAGRDAQ